MDENREPRAARVVLGLWVVAAGAALAVWATSGDVAAPAAAQASPSGACRYQPIPVPTSPNELVNPPTISPSAGVLDTELDVEFTDPSKTRIYGCPLHLRSYNGKLVGPTLRLRPGDDLRIALHNDLPVESPAQLKEEFEQESSAAHLASEPHGFNTTNLHTHGLHVSPRGNGDNVLLAIAPQTTEQYDIEIPGDHASGTFWYHAHGHGSTAIQVGSGMAGTIVIEDDPKAIPPALAAANAREKVMVFQTIPYDTNGEVETISSFFPVGNPQDCVQGKPTCVWSDSDRRTTINGQVVPKITMQRGEVQRWRMVGGAFAEGLHLQLQGHDLHEIALDGIYLGRVDTWRKDDKAQFIDLEPGYRSDVLVQASMSPGTYELVDLAAPAEDSLLGKGEDRQVVAKVVVTEGPALNMSLPTDAEMKPLAPFGQRDLRTVAQGVQVAQFKVGHEFTRPSPSPSGGASPSPLPSLSPARTYFQINYEAFDPKRVRRLELGAVEAWSLSTVGDPAGVGTFPPRPHVFHIHINPFQVVRNDPDGRPELVWKDTLLVPPTIEPSDAVVVFTKYEDFTGKFVIHCHILDHEDLGMMEVVKVVKPGALLDPPPGKKHRGGH